MNEHGSQVYTLAQLIQDVPALKRLAEHVIIQAVTITAENWSVVRIDVRAIPRT